ncbi:hypothetical protein IWX90DRAFT_20228 [Phyllosticta citrichinensis]|uniref:Uncharacterized protein n=1 Tax=Phyllosticta citrichinensis TaxID=1130410 RepID=A0ABR1Y6X7_9PEZI
MDWQQTGRGGCQSRVDGCGWRIRTRRHSPSSDARLSSCNNNNNLTASERIHFHSRNQTRQNPSHPAARGRGAAEHQENKERSKLKRLPREQRDESEIRTPVTADNPVASASRMESPATTGGDQPAGQRPDPRARNANSRHRVLAHATRCNADTPAAWRLCCAACPAPCGAAESALAMRCGMPVLLLTAGGGFRCDGCQRRRRS